MEPVVSGSCFSASARRRFAWRTSVLVIPLFISGLVLTVGGEKTVGLALVMTVFVGGLAFFVCRHLRLRGYFVPILAVIAVLGGLAMAGCGYGNSERVEDEFTPGFGTDYEDSMRGPDLCKVAPIPIAEYINSQPLEVPSIPAGGPVRLVKVLAQEGYNADAGRPCLSLEISLRNVGTESAYLKSARIDVEESWHLRATCRQGGGGGYQPVTGRYQAVLKLAEVPSVSLVSDVSQVVDPGGTDRFSIFAVIDEGDRDDEPWDIVRLKLTLFYNEGNEIVQTEDFLVLSVPRFTSKEFMRPTSGAGFEAKVFEVNVTAARAAAARNVAVTPVVQQYLDFFLGEERPSVCRL